MDWSLQDVVEAIYYVGLVVSLGLGFVSGRLR